MPDLGVIDTAGLRYKLNVPQRTGIISVDGLFSDLLKRNATNTNQIDILGGTAQIKDDNDFGQSRLQKVFWETQTISVGIVTGNFIVAIDKSSIIQIIDNEGQSDLLPSQVSDGFLKFGNFTAVSGFITQTFIAGQLATNDTISLYSIQFAIGAFNLEGQAGFFISEFGSVLNVQISAGSSYSFGAAAIDNTASPDIITRPSRAPVTIIALGNPFTGAFTFSPTAEIDPNRVGKSGNIAQFASAAGGLETTVTSMAHGMLNGDTVTIQNTTNYNGDFIISNKTANTYQIVIPFVGDDAIGDWSGLTTTTNNVFTNQHIFLFPQSGITAFVYGQAEYNTILDASNGERLEGFIAPVVLQKAIAVGTLVVKQGITDFTNQVNFIFKKPINRFRQ